MKFHLILLPIALGTILGKNSFLPYMSRSLIEGIPEKLPCASNPNESCDLCGSADFYSVSLKYLATFRPNISQLATTLLQSLSEADVLLAQRETLFCFSLRDPVSIPEGVSIYSILSNFFKINFIEKYVVPFMKFEDFELSHLSFTLDVHSQAFYLNHVSFKSESDFEISKYAALQDLVFTYNGTTGLGVASGALKVALFYRKLEFSLDLDTRSTDGWNIDLNTGTDKLGDILTSFSNFTENSPIAKVRDFLNDLPTRFDVNLILKGVRVAIEKATLSLVKKDFYIDVLPNLFKIKSITSLFSLLSLEFKIPESDFTQTCDFRVGDSFKNYETFKILKKNNTINTCDTNYTLE
jgi:hypothetical protein